ncbi:TetR/AcrR family transcriptional regulator [Microlunatus sp. GCM10028923]|uniref:TetR/AcrR family transcriptional regulator n=1 Tax=Microlunatus sp. GCM10028923 TaxID=3273400 RepID=UPI0036092A0E
MSRTAESGTRDRILATARDLFGAHTYGATSMRQVAEGVGITKASLYHHFTSKAEILAELIDPPVSELGTAIEAAEQLTSLAARQQALLEGCIDAMLRHRETMALLLKDASVYGDQTLDAMDRVVGFSQRAVAVLAGPRPNRRQRIRAAQAFAAATDPISQFADVPVELLRAELLAGALAVLSHNAP